MEEDTLFSKIFGAAADLRKLPAEETSPEIGRLRRQSLEIEELFTQIVDSLRNPLFTPLPPINDLMRLFWDLVGRKITPNIITTDPLSGINFWAEIKGNHRFASVICPQNWGEMVRVDPIMQFGGLVSVASKAADYYSGKFERGVYREQHVQQRAYGYEAEYLRFIRSLNIGWEPNEYQSKVLHAYPNGLDSVDPRVRYKVGSFQE